MHSVTDRQTDRGTDDRVMPIADYTVQQYDRLNVTLFHTFITPWWDNNIASAHYLSHVAFQLVQLRHFQVLHFQRFPLCPTSQIFVIEKVLTTKILRFLWWSVYYTVNSRFREINCITSTPFKHQYIIVLCTTSQNSFSFIIH